MKKLSLLVVLIITLKTAQFVKAQETAAEPVAVKNFFTSTDDLLSRNGLTAQFSQTTDASVHLQGQDKFSNPRMRHLLKFSLTLQSKQLGWQDGRFFAVAHSHGGRDGAIYADTFQGISNIDSSNRTHLYEMWFEQNLFGKKMRIKAGKVDANTEFAFVENALDFINPSMGFSPTIVGFPTFPDGHPSLNVFAYPGNGTYAGLGWYALKDGGTFSVAETGKKWGDAHEGRLGVGMWTNTASFERFDGETQSGTKGFYLVLDQRASKAVRSFFQFGYADGNVSKATHHIGGGITVTGAIPERATDVIGFGATNARLVSADGTGRNSEFAIESFYKISIRPWVQFAPGVQYIRQPNGNADRSNALVGTVRLTINPSAGFKSTAVE